MGETKTLMEYRSPSRPPMVRLPKGLVRRRPRRYAEWKTLRAWKRLPEWEADSIGYRMRLTREKAGLTQSELASRLGCSQQAVAQAERWPSNPTVEFVRRWASACGSAARVEID